MGQKIKTAYKSGLGHFCLQCWCSRSGIAKHAGSSLYLCSIVSLSTQQEVGFYQKQPRCLQNWIWSFCSKINRASMNHQYAARPFGCLLFILASRNSFSFICWCRHLEIKVESGGTRLLLGIEEKKMSMSMSGQEKRLIIPKTVQKQLPRRNKYSRWSGGAEKD